MTDPARTTKLTRQELVRVNDEFKSERDAAKGDAMRAFDERNIALNAADALRAQVAALQAENERLTRERDESSRALKEWWDHDNKRIVELEHELAAAQAKLAVPVPSRMVVVLEFLREAAEESGALVPMPKEQTVEWEAADMLESLARDNAALRTKAEALERERDWFDHNTTFYDVTNDAPTQGGNVPTLASVSKRIWYHATYDQDSYPFSAVIAAALAEKP